MLVAFCRGIELDGCSIFNEILGGFLQRIFAIFPAFVVISVFMLTGPIDKWVQAMVSASKAQAAILPYTQPGVIRSERAFKHVLGISLRCGNQDSGVALVGHLMKKLGGKSNPPCVGYTPSSIPQGSQDSTASDFVVTIIPPHDAMKGQPQ